MRFLVSFIVVVFTSSICFAAGGFDCTSEDGKVVIEGVDSSAGTVVRSVTVDGQALKKGDDFQLSQLLNNVHQFSVSLMDSNYNETVLTFNTVKAYPLAAGLLWYKDHEPQVIKCEFSY